MNRQQKSLLIAVSGMLALLLVVLLVIALNRPAPDQPETRLDPLAATDAPATDAAGQPLSEEEMGRQAMSEEEDKDEPEDEGELPVD